MKRIVLCSGLSGPAVILDALAQLGTDPGRRPDEIHVVCDGRSRDRMASLLLDAPKSSGLFAKRCRELRIPRDAIAFNRQTLHVPADPSGREVRQVRTESDIEALADLSFAIVRREAVDGASVTVALTGFDIGSHFLLSSLQLVGRVWDRAVVDLGTSPRKWAFCRRQVHWVEIPLVVTAANPMAVEEGYVGLSRLRRRQMGYAASPPGIVLDDPERSIRVGAAAVRLTPVQYFWYSSAVVLITGFSIEALRTAVCTDHHGRAIIASNGSDGLVPHLQARYESVGLRCGSLAETIRRATAEPPNLVSIISKTNARIEAALGPGAEPFLLRQRSEEGNRSYSTSLSQRYLSVVPTLLATLLATLTSSIFA